MLLCPSIMCADLLKLEEEIKRLDEAGSDIFHMDIMDGCFVPNITLGLNDFRAVRKLTKKPMDAHLMINDPKDKVDWFIDAGAAIVYIHPESGNDMLETLKHIRERYVKSGIAINPETTIGEVEELLPYSDYILVMTVHPGFAGQKFIEEVKDKIKDLVELKKKYGYQIVIDGGCSPDRIRELHGMGCDGYVLGTSALFGKDKPYKELLNKLKQ